MGPKGYFGPSIIFSPVLCQASLTETQSDFPLINDTVLLSLPKLFEPFWFGHFKGKAYIIQKKSPEKVIFQFGNRSVCLPAPIIIFIQQCKL